MEENVTEPHGWPVETDTYSAPCTATGDVGVSFKHGGSVTACIADGWEREDTHLTSEQARMYAKELAEAADILDAFTGGEYVPPESTYIPRPRRPAEQAMMDRFASGAISMLTPRANGLLGIFDKKDESAKDVTHYEFKGKS